MKSKFNIGDKVNVVGSTLVFTVAKVEPYDVFGHVIIDSSGRLAFEENDLELVKTYNQKYISIESSITLAFQKAVNDKIEKGYLPQGGVCYADGYYTQAMFYGCQ